MEHPKRVTGLTLNPALMNNRDDHRPHDVLVTPADHTALSSISDEAARLIHEVTLAAEFFQNRKKLIPGLNVTTPKEGDFGHNPAAEVGQQEPKITRLVEALHADLATKMQELSAIFTAKGCPEIDADLAPLLGEPYIHYTMCTLKDGIIGCTPMDRLEGLGLSFEGIKPNDTAKTNPRL